MTNSKNQSLIHVTDEETLRAITDQTLLYRIARRHRNAEFRRIATEMLESQEQLTRLASARDGHLSPERHRPSAPRRRPPYVLALGRPLVS